MIHETLPGDEYGLHIDTSKAENARLFMSRKTLTEHCAGLVPQNPFIAEVGVFQGKFSETLLRVFKPRKFFMIDTFSVDDHIDKLFTAENHFDYIQKKFVDKDVFFFIKGFSWDGLHYLLDDSLDYIYIDADHTYDSVKMDIEAAYRKIKSGGILQFNDYCTYSLYEDLRYGVLNAVNEFIESHNVTLVGLSIDRSGYHDLAVQVRK